MKTRFHFVPGPIRGLAIGLGIALAAPVAHATWDTELADARIDAHGGAVANAGDLNGDGYDDLVVGAQDSLGQRGAVYVFLGRGAGLVPGNAPDTVITTDADFARLGSSVAGAGDVNGDGYDDLIVATSHLTTGSAGAALIFHGSATGIPSGTAADATTVLSGPFAQIEFFVPARTVAGAGDVNGDGYDDVIVGAPVYAAPDNNEGAAFIFLGSASGIPDGSPATADAQLESNQGNAEMGQVVASAGDVDHDGYDDVAVTALRYNACCGRGAVFVFRGGPAGIAGGDPTTADTAIVSFLPPFDHGEVGDSLAHGDVNGDGFDDLIVGASRYLFGRGGVFVFPGSASGVADRNLTSPVPGQLISTQTNAHFGEGVASADVDGDGYDDVIGGAPDFGDGAVFVYAGSSGGPGALMHTLSNTLVNTTPPLAPSIAFGRHVAALHLDGDGNVDLAVGGPEYGDSYPLDPGTVFVYGSPTCGNGIDDDGDGAIDFPADPGCSSAADGGERAPTLVCDDGHDQDGDGYTDFPTDPGCKDLFAAIENPKCQDGISNDQDGKIDFDGGASHNGGVALTVPDPQCTAAWQNKEAAGNCGVGAELLVVLGAWARLRRRSRAG